MASATCYHCKKKFSSEPVVIDRHKFCGESCADSYESDKTKDKIIKDNTKSKLSQSEKQYKEKLIDYLSKQYDNPNYPMLLRQVKTMREEYNISHQDVWLTIVYAERYEHFSYNPQYGLGQIEKFIFPSLQQRKRVKKVKSRKVNEKLFEQTGVRNGGHYVQKKIDDEGEDDFEE